MKEKRHGTICIFGSQEKTFTEFYCAYREVISLRKQEFSRDGKMEKIQGSVKQFNARKSRMNKKQEFAKWFKSPDHEIVSVKYNRNNDIWGWD